MNSVHRFAGDLCSDESPAGVFQVAVEIERAALRVAANYDTSTRFEQKKVREALTVIVHAIHSCVRGDGVADCAQFAWTTEATTLLASMRRELLGAAQRCTDENGDRDNRDVVRYLLAIEELSASIERDVAARFTSQFAGANALKLLVEVAHDMASPLSAILFLVERLQHGHSGPVTSAQERHLALVYSAAFGLSTLSSDMMELARGGARLTDEGPRAFSIGDVLRGVRDLVQPLAEERKLALRFSGPPLDRRIGHPAALSRVLLNLTTNAFKFTTVGSVTVLVEQATDADALVFSVEDSGRGIPEAELADIFSVFTQRDASRNASFSSAGLGLAICHKLVSALGGTLAVTSQVNRGTRFTFTLTLPLASPATTA